MKGPARWFLPENPNLLGRLRQQVDLCCTAAHTLNAWANGDEGAGDRLRDLEHQADDLKREVLSGLRVAFAPPIEGEDLFTLSQGFESLINNMKNVVREADVLDLSADDGLRQMTAKLVEGVEQLRTAVGHIDNEEKAATDAADRAIKCDHDIEHLYRVWMSASLTEDDFRVAVSRRELYRRMARLGEGLSAVADRVWYSVIKEG